MREGNINNLSDIKMMDVSGYIAIVLHITGIVNRLMGAIMSKASVMRRYRPPLHRHV